MAKDAENMAFPINTARQTLRARLLRSCGRNDLPEALFSLTLACNDVKGPNFGNDTTCHTYPPSSLAPGVAALLPRRCTTNDGFCSATRSSAPVPFDQDSDVHVGDDTSAAKLQHLYCTNCRCCPVPPGYDPRRSRRLEVFQAIKSLPGTLSVSL